MINLEDLRHEYRREWEIRDDIAYGAAAIRKTPITADMYARDMVNVILVRDPRDLAEQLAIQRARSKQCGKRL
ncbi:hypothetical protein [Nonomuraea lactucae]|uniref:hypothetical protein n=1 Tax=Nonomuraea lactucae TaxID=2249762 RepID=UPI000DE398DB|nr:hypothetical protein [Nonomuraea lactucae]